MGASVIDIGAGPGGHAAELTKKGRGRGRRSVDDEKTAR